MCVVGKVFTYAEELQQKTIRVGAFEGSYIHTSEDGKLSGYGYEFQQAVASYTGWKYEYVPSDIIKWKMQPKNRFEPYKKQRSKTTEDQWS